MNLDAEEQISKESIDALLREEEGEECLKRGRHSHIAVYVSTQDGLFYYNCASCHSTLTAPLPLEEIGILIGETDLPTIRDSAPITIRAPVYSLPPEHVEFCKRPSPFPVSSFACNR